MAIYFMSTTGNNANGGSNGTSDAFATVDYATVNILSAGDILEIMPGTYNQQIGSPGAGFFGTSWSNAITIRAYLGGAVTFHPTGNVPGYTLLFNSNERYIIFDGITFIGYGTVNGPVNIEMYNATYGNPHHIRLIRCTLIADTTSVWAADGRNCINCVSQVAGCPGGHELLYCTMRSAKGYGIYIGADNCRVEYCNIYDVNSTGIHASNSYGGSGATAHDMVINGNRVHDIVNSVDGRFWAIINGSGAPERTKYYNNRVWNIGGSDPADAGIDILSGVDVEIVNNVIVNCGGVGINLAAYASPSEIQDTIVRNNISYGNSQGNYHNGGTGTVFDHNMTDGTNPGFLDAANGDFRITSTSPGYHTGVFVSTNTVDASGAMFNNPPSIGALEVSGGFVPSDDRTRIPSETYIVDNDGSVWTLGSGTTPNIEILRNGSNASAGFGIGAQILWLNDTIYVEGNNGFWYSWNGTSYDLYGPDDPEDLSPPSDGILVFMMQYA